MNIEAVDPHDEEATRRLPGRFSSVLNVEQTDQVFVAKIDGEVVGMARITYFRSSRCHFGLLSMLELKDTRADYADDIARRLISAGRKWLEQQRKDTQLLVAPLPWLESFLTLEALRRTRALYQARQDEFPTDGSSRSVQAPHDVWA